MQILETIAKNTGLPVTGHAFDRVLAAIAATADPWEIVDLADQPFNLTVEAVKVLADEGLARFEGGQVYLTEAGRRLLQERGVVPTKLHRCPFCGGSGVDLREFSSAYETFLRIAEDRPKPTDEFDQGVLTPLSAMRRVALMKQRGDLVGKRVAILGDDDLMTLAIGLAGEPEEIVTFEIDDRYVRFIRHHAERLGIPARVFTFDLRQKLPEDLFARFDTFLTDPPENYAGLFLFLERGFGLLKPGDGRAGYFGMTLTESSLSKWARLQQWLVSEHRIVLTDLVFEHSEYENWDFLLESIRSDVEPYTHFPKIHWYRSSFYRVETLDGFEPRNPTFEGADIYSDEERLVYSKEIGSRTSGQDERR
ncbi:MAG: bis-aminopropyl spermidine synthase family protein [candidate division KSB1 bacterium]|nr:bis-aminopropyl spermidine synthase family protein [candidate division KSB1 bacterium]